MTLPRVDWNETNQSQLAAQLAEVPLTDYPELAGYTRAEIHAGLAGQGGLFLATQMVRRLNLGEGDRVLDLGCGSGTTSAFLAKHCRVQVFAVDGDSARRDEIEATAKRWGVADRVAAITADARELPFADEWFDAVFCMNAFFYFGTDDLYLPRLVRCVRPGGELVVGSPCYREEPTNETPEEFLLEFPACLAVHSPAWWRTHWEKMRVVDVLHSAETPHGARFWSDRVRRLLEERDMWSEPAWVQDMVRDMMRMLARDKDGFVTHFVLHARKRCNESR